MKSFRQYISEARLEPGGEDAGKLFGPKGEFSPNAPNAPKEPSFRDRVGSGELPRPRKKSDQEIYRKRKIRQTRIDARREPTFLERIKSGNLTPPAKKSSGEVAQSRRERKARIEARKQMQGGNTTPPAKKSNKKTAARTDMGSFPVVTNNLFDEHKNSSPDKIRAAMKKHTPAFIKHSDALTSHLHDYHKSGGAEATDYSRATHADKAIAAHFKTLSDKISSVKPLPIHSKFGRASISHFSVDRGFPEERTLKIHFNPLKTYVSGSSELKELTSHLEKHTDHSWYIHPESGHQMVGRERPLVLATTISHPWLREESDGESDGGGGGGGRGGRGGRGPKKPKPNKPSGKQPTRPKAPALV
jgi:hypothetical protein